MKRLLTISLAIVLALGLSIVSIPAQPAMAQTTINVPTDYPTIQAGINAASAGDTVQVADGTYYESITLKSGVIVQGAGAGDTTIDSGFFPWVVTAINVDSAAKLDGFTITGNDNLYGISISFSSSPTISNNTITDNAYGIHNSFDSSPTISNNTITGNNEGIFNELGSSPAISNNVITGNNWNGIHNSFASPTISNNTITGNYYGIRNYFDSSPTITNNTITSNEYGIYNYVDSSPTISNNIIIGKGDDEYGIYNDSGSSPTITNNTITGNEYGIHNSFVSSPTITNNTITGNEYGIHNSFVSSPTVTNSILWDNGQEIYNDIFSMPVVTYSDIEGGYTGTGNIDADPLFVNPAANDYHLQSTSPCIDAGSNAAVPSWLTIDYEGEPRIGDGDGDGDAVVDMGADEYYISDFDFDIEVSADADGSPLAVTIEGVYDSTPANGTTPYTINDVPDGNTVTLTAPLIHIEGTNVYSFLGWDIGDNNAPGVTSFAVDANITATASYHQEIENYVTGGGNIKHEVEKGNRTIEKVAYSFGGNVGISDVYGIVGNFQVVDHTGAKAEAWHCTTGDFIYLAFDDLLGDPGAETPEASNDTAIIIGEFSSNRGSTTILAIIIWDSQEPGKDFDMICIGDLGETTDLSNWDPWIGSIFSPETISGGNFQLHDYD